MIRELIKPDNILLRRISEPVDAPGELIWDLFDTMRSRAGIGLAAVQLGILSRVAVVECCELSEAIINPKILETSDYTETWPEGCLSLPGVVCKVSRPVFAVVEWTNNFGARRIHPLYGLPARAVLHEIDHMDGKLITDYDAQPAGYIYGTAD